jgi:hypothetical protein
MAHPRNSAPRSLFISNRAWSTLGHSGPGFYDDIRFDLEPTRIDRTELLTLIEKALAARGNAGKDANPSAVKLKAAGNER